MDHLGNMHMRGHRDPHARDGECPRDAFVCVCLSADALSLLLPAQTESPAEPPAPSFPAVASSPASPSPQPSSPLP
eukprot:1749767-Pleurochrysis_carterae.AAC.1